MWAKGGECEKNPGYMWGGDGSDSGGECRMACSKCKICAGPSDRECIQENRASGNFINYVPEVRGRGMACMRSVGAGNTSLFQELILLDVTEDGAAPQRAAIPELYC